MYRSSDQMYPIVEEYLGGKKTKQSICAVQNLSPQVFSYWIKKYQSKKVEAPEVFSALSISPSVEEGQMIIIQLPNGTRIEIPMA